MKIDHLIQYFSNEMSKDELISTIDSELIEYKEKRAKRGSVVPLILESNSRNLIIGDKEIGKLTADFNPIEAYGLALDYICDVLSLSEQVEFVSEDHRSKIELMMSGDA